MTRGRGSALPLGAALGTLWMLLGLTAGTAQAPTAAPGEPEFVIIVNAANPIESLPAKTLSRMFLKKRKSWDDDVWGEKVKIEPFDLEERSDARRAFTRRIHDKSTGAIKSYWQREIFSGRESSPLELESDEQMMERVASEKGAIGYVSGSAELIGNLKVLEVAEK